jgi:hypothetical protein
MKSGIWAITISAAALPAALGAVVLPTVIMGCSGATDEAGEDVALILPDPGAQEAWHAEVESGENEKVCNVPRPFVDDITLHDGNWGSWGCIDWCPSDSYVYAINLRSEPHQMPGDDTAMNGISGWCFNRYTGQHNHFVTSTVGGWGSWQLLNNILCNNVNTPIAGGQLRVEGSQGSGDDTSANSLKFACLGSPGTWTEVGHANNNWGSWGSQALCPGGSAVCGIQTRVEGNQGGGDDTSLNGARFYCCAF